MRNLEKLPNMLCHISPLKIACAKLDKATCTVLFYFLLEILQGLVFEVYKALLHYFICSLDHFEQRAEIIIPTLPMKKLGLRATMQLA